MYYTKITGIGLAKLTQAQNSSGHIDIAGMVIGDGNGAAVAAPTGSENALVNQVLTGPVNAVTDDPNDPSQRLIEIIIPANVGGFAIREIGLLDSDGDLFAYGNFPEHYKPLASEGSASSLVITVAIKLNNSANVVLNVTNSIFSPTRGGLKHQMLIKQSNDDSDTTWTNQLNARNYFTGQF